MARAQRTAGAFLLSLYPAFAGFASAPPSASPSIVNRIRAGFPAVAERLGSSRPLVTLDFRVGGASYPGLAPVHEPSAGAGKEGAPLTDEALHPIFPLHHGDPTVVACRDQRVAIRPLGLVHRTPANTTGGLLTYPAAYPETDIVYKVGQLHIEEFLLLASPAAPLRFDYEVVETEGVTAIAIEDGHVRFRSRSGPGLRIDPPYLIDAAGVYSDAAVRWEVLASGERSILRLTVNPAGLAYPLLVDPNWSFGGLLLDVRVHHTVTLLGDARVLVAGGSATTITAPRRSAEIWDPASRTSAYTAPMISARHRHTATLLGDGQVLIAGGTDKVPDGGIAEAEIYDPRTGTWTATGSMGTPRFYHTATLLFDGKVLVTGGQNLSNVALTSAEIYDPATGTWSQTGPLVGARTQHTATLLPDGRVLAAGGGGLGTGAPLQTAEIYDPAARSWSDTTPMLYPHLSGTATSLDGRNSVLVAGGSWSVWPPASPGPRGEHCPRS